jgi:hypothetical protein
MLKFKTFNKEEVVFYFSSTHFVIQEWTTPNEAFYYFLDKDIMIFKKHSSAFSISSVYCGIGNFAEIGDTFYLEEDLPNYYA